MGNRLLLALAVLACLAGTALSCALPPAGCTKAMCDSLASPPAVTKPRFDKDKASTYDERLAYWMGLYNKRYNAVQKAAALRKKGGPSLNYEAFNEIGYVLKYSTATSLKACCHDCRVTAGCYVYQYFDTESSTGRLMPKGFKKGTRCYLLKGGADTTDDPTGHGAPRSGTHVQQTQSGDGYSPIYNPSYVGGLCNGNSTVTDDPHFTGAQGTPFDFNGDLDKSFCLTADRDLQINVLLSGYRVPSSEASGKKPLRTWIKEIGIVWNAPSAAADDAAAVSSSSTGAGSRRHTFRLVARSGKQQERGENGFLAAVYLDSTPVAPPTSAPGTSLSAHGLTLTFLEASKLGLYDVDRFSLTIDGLLDTTLSMRVAHPKLQAPDDAEAHFNIGINDLAASASVHGLLGQTYRSTPAQQAKAVRYSALARLLHGRVAADGESGQGFLEGEVVDYETTDVTSPNCKFSTFSS